MMKNNHLIWKKPLINTIKFDEVNKTVKVQSCSKYMGTPCNPMYYYIDSFPGGGKPERE